MQKKVSEEGANGGNMGIHGLRLHPFGQSQQKGVEIPRGHLFDSWDIPTFQETPEAKQNVLPACDGSFLDPFVVPAEVEKLIEQIRGQRLAVPKTRRRLEILPLLLEGEDQEITDLTPDMASIVVCPGMPMSPLKLEFKFHQKFP